MYFISPYPDELFSSVIARYHCIYSGHITASQTAEELFGDPRALPSVELLGRLSQELVTSMEKTMPLREWLLKHTMFPEYSCFLPAERYEQAVDTALQMDLSSLRYLLYMPRGRTDNYLKYCPVCAVEDQRMYGEAYWHRSHQLQGIWICPLHKCSLRETTVSRVKGQGMLEATAEDTLPKIDDVQYAKPVRTAIELRTAEFCCRVFTLAEKNMLLTDVNNTVPIGEFLRSQIRLEYPISKRGALADLDRFVSEMEEYYGELPGFPKDIKETVKRMYKGHTMPFYEVCLMGLFLGISPKELLLPMIRTENCAEQFDERVRAMFNSDRNYSDISKEMGIDRVYVKQICSRGTRKIAANQREPRQSTKTRSVYDWLDHDREMLPKVKAIILEMLDEKHPPERVTVGGIARKVGTTSAYMKRLPQCMKLIQRNISSVEENRAKKLAWVVQKVDKEGHILSKQRIFELVHMDRHMIETAIPFLMEYASAEECSRIKELMER